jgi:DNA-binding response OmpR family regulator
VSGHRVLIAEDESVVAMDLETELRQRGYSVVGIAASASEVLRLADEQLPDIVLLDIHLQGSGDGLLVAARLEQNSQPPGIVLMTAAPRTEVLDKAQAQWGVLSKPFNMQELQQAIAAALKQNKYKRRKAHR